MNNCVILTLKNQKALKDRKFQKIRIVLANGCMFMYNFFHEIFALLMPQDEKTYWMNMCNAVFYTHCLDCWPKIYLAYAITALLFEL